MYNIVKFLHYYELLLSSEWYVKPDGGMENFGTGEISELHTDINEGLIQEVLQSALIELSLLPNNNESFANISKSSVTIGEIVNVAYEIIKCQIEPCLNFVKIRRAKAKAVVVY